MATKKAAKKPARRAPAKSTKRPAKRTVASSSATGLRLNSVTPSYTVNNLEKTIAWYCKGLGFKVSERWEHEGELRGVMLKAGPCMFAFSQDDFAKGRDRQKGEGHRVHVYTTQNVDVLAKRVRSHGGTVTMAPTDTSWGTRSFSVEDPDGFKITFSKKV